MVQESLKALRRSEGVVRLHGHRGARGVFPENTMAGYQHAFEVGLNIIEIDVLLTADGIPVLTHNPTLMAASTRDAQGLWLESEGPKISDLPLEVLQRFDIGGLRAGTVYADRFPDQAFMSDMRVPRLADVAALLAAPEHSQSWLNVEIKSVPGPALLTPSPQTLAEKTVGELRKAGIENRIILQSFDWRVLEHVARIAPAIPRSHLTYLDRPEPPMAPNVYPGSEWMAGRSLSEHGGSLPRLIAAMGGSVWSPWHEDVSAGDVADAHDAGLIVNVWTVNEAAEFDRAIDAGVDGIITDYPGRAQRHLLARGLNWRVDALPVSPAPVRAAG